MDQENGDPGVVGNEQEQLQVHHLAAVPMQELEREIENLNNECVEDQSLPVRNALEELRALEMRFGVQNEYERYVSGGEDVDREPLDERLREMESQILERPLVNLDFEMMEILHHQEAQENSPS
ncbi:hypothetical protein QAD02_020522 [Eretmocerus hayati]|uniref:Uncharacterized protein n=1 Tax=Eretmocerus hayati TaxID=131215 RepID=A0ACC2PMC1_9HYME|nr:hypothetical protein QAD02_020522 [Eretmocerus hayati]